MKKLLFLLVFIPLISFSQVKPINPGLYSTYPDKPNVTKVNTRVNATATTNFTKENELVLSEEKTNVKTPLTADLSNYTDILLVNISVVIFSLSNILLLYIFITFSAVLFTYVNNHLSSLDILKFLLLSESLPIVNNNCFSDL